MELNNSEIYTKQEQERQQVDYRLPTTTHQGITAPSTQPRPASAFNHTASSSNTKGNRGGIKNQSTKAG